MTPVLGELVKALIAIETAEAAGREAFDKVDGNVSIESLNPYNRETEPMLRNAFFDGYESVCRHVYGDPEAQPRMTMQEMGEFGL